MPTTQGTTTNITTLDTQMEEAGYVPAVDARTGIRIPNLWFATDEHFLYLVVNTDGEGKPTASGVSNTITKTGAPRWITSPQEFETKHKGESNSSDILLVLNVGKRNMSPIRATNAVAYKDNGRKKQLTERKPAAKKPRRGKTVQAVVVEE